MILLLTLTGGALAGLLYAADGLPGVGRRRRNALGIVAAAAVGAVLWQMDIRNAWAFPAAWVSVFLVLWASQYQIETEDAVWVRAATSVFAVLLLFQFFQ